MKLSTLPVLPDRTYDAVLRLPEAVPGLVQTARARLRTGGDGSVIQIDASVGYFPETVAQASEFLVLEDLTSGSVIDLRPHTAAATGDLDLAKQALGEQADLDQRTRGGGTALHWCGVYAHRAVTKLLLDHGADPNATDDTGRTPLVLAAEQENLAIATLLHSRGGSLDAKVHGKSVSIQLDLGVALLLAAERGDAELVGWALDAGADVNVVTDAGWTPLLSAIDKSPLLTHVLLERGADPNLASHEGYTPLMRAAGLGARPQVQALLAAGARRDAVDHTGKTAHQLALESGQIECAEAVR